MKGLIDMTKAEVKFFVKIMLKPLETRFEIGEVRVSRFAYATTCLRELRYLNCYQINRRKKICKIMRWMRNHKLITKNFYCDMAENLLG